MKEVVLFFRRFLMRRGRIGSIVPSSRFLTKRVMQMIPFDHLGTIYELGAGTGALTKELIRRKKPPTKLIIFEPDEEFAPILIRKFYRSENVTIVNRKADDLHASVNEMGLTFPDCVVSSIPFATLGEETSRRIFSEITHLLGPNGLFVLYQYTLLTLPLILKYFKIKQFAFMPFNFPPALVFMCTPLEVVS